MLASIYPLVLVVTFTLLSAFCDALSFTHAARVWQGNMVVWREVLYSAGAIMTGTTLYWIAVRYLNQAGIVSAELQTLLWFGAAAVGVAALNGHAFHWKPVDQVVAVGVLIGIGWLLCRAEG
jgi:hypothetical protein